MPCSTSAQRLSFLGAVLETIGGMSRQQAQQHGRATRRVRLHPPERGEIAAREARRRQLGRDACNDLAGFRRRLLRIRRLRIELRKLLSGEEPEQALGPGARAIAMDRGERDGAAGFV